MEPKKIINRKYAKFRIWDEDKKRFYFSGETQIIRDKDKSLVVPSGIPIDYKVKEDFAIDITEFTGILDATPEMRPIYTGDIVTLSNADGMSVGRGVVNWITEVASFNVSLDLMKGFMMKIIGNIFQDKELLEKIQQEAQKPKLDLSGNIQAALGLQKKLVN